jgi:hypothetical protein
MLRLGVKKKGKAKFLHSPAKFAGIRPDFARITVEDKKGRAGDRNGGILVKNENSRVIAVWTDEKCLEKN